jgi:hypothetical protein
VKDAHATTISNRRAVSNLLHLLGVSLSSARRLVGAFALLVAARAAAQDVGHKMIGTLGLHAGAQPDPGLYAADRAFFYTAERVNDRHGEPIPGPIDLDVFENAIGVAGTYRLPRLRLYVNGAVSIPIQRVSVTTDRPEASVDRFGLSDIYVAPLWLGWRSARLEVVTGYAFYIPTGRFEPGGHGGVSHAQWSHDFSLGGTVYFDRARTWMASGLGTFTLNQPKIGIDITRGETFQVQGGAGKILFGIVDVGVVGYGLWQVRDDRGSALPPLLRGARDRIYGAGGEVDLTIARLRTKVTLRYAHDFAVVSRPAGQIVLIGISVLAWRPRARAAR